MNRKVNMTKAKHAIGVIIPTLNASKHLSFCLPPLVNSPLKPHILVIDSSSTDNTLEVAKSFGVETLVIKRSDFNHGATREIARKHLNAELFVMMTPDAYPIDRNAIEYLIKPLIENRASAVYGRQIPHRNAFFLEGFLRSFNYPATSHVRSLKDIHLFGKYLFFFSDSFAAYKNCALDSIGGFSSVLIGEDTVAAAKLLRKGHNIAYAAEAVAHHSHRYTISEEFRRYFDTGLARADYKELLACEYKDSHLGRQFFRALMKTTIVQCPWLFPYACVQTGAKWLGYRLGHASKNAPTWWKKAFSGQKYYWNSQYYLENKK